MRDRLLRRFAFLMALILAGCVSPTPPRPGDAERGWVDSIRAKIRTNLQIPPNTPPYIEAAFSVVQLPSGEILRVQLLASSGFKPYDEAAERAIWKSSPLPKAPAPDLFRRELHLKFQPRTKEVVVTEPTTAESTRTQEQMNALALEIARLEAEIQSKVEEFHKRPRKTFVGARPSGQRLAEYVQQLTKKMESVGNANYPDEARGRIFGTALVAVTIRRDGSLESATIERSSGHEVLDRAALRIVQLASPFEPFPPEISQDTDLLVIIRTWRFEPGETVGSPGP